MEKVLYLYYTGLLERYGQLQQNGSQSSRIRASDYSIFSPWREYMFGKLSFETLFRPTAPTSVDLCKDQKLCVMA